MLGSLPLLAGLGMLVLLLLAAYIALPGKRPHADDHLRPSMAMAAISQPVAPTYSDPIPYRHRSARDYEIDEDADLIADDYRRTAQAAYRQAALDRHRESLINQSTQVATQAALQSWAANNANASTTGKSSKATG
jgi:hypothetical protein